VKNHSFFGVNSHSKISILFVAMLAAKIIFVTSIPVMVKAQNKRSQFIRIIAVYMIPVALLLLFAYTGASKLVSHSLFLHQLSKMPLIKSYAAFISYFIPTIELVTAILLMIAPFRVTGLILSCLLMASFTAFVAFVLTGKHQPCSCGGVISEMNWAQHLIFNSAFTVLAITSLWYHKYLHVYKGVSRKLRVSNIFSPNNYCKK
jgi:hypothetical protein